MHHSPCVMVSPWFFPGIVHVFASSKESGAVRPGKPRVLVVEDEFFIGVQLERCLINAGCDVVALESRADTAIAIALEQRPDFVVMDIRIIGPRDGIEAAGEIFALCGIRSLFVTAHGDPPTRERAVGSRPLGWVSKPFTEQQFSDAVSSALGQLSEE